MLQKEIDAMKYTLPLLLAIAAASVSAADWPQFYGPNRDNKSTDTGLLKTWPEEGPSRIWEAAGIGEGYSTVAIVGKRIYTTGAIDGDCVITALAMEGKKVWARKNGKAWKISYPGTRSTPTINDGLLYHLSGIGNLICLKADNGDVIWSANILKKFGGRNITWGLAESPLVVGDKVICTPGGEDVSIVALDGKTGEVVWKCTGVGDEPGYASPILIEYQGLQQIVTAMSESIIGVRASDGKLLWRYPHEVYTNQNITTPLFQDGFLIVSGCGKKGTTSLQLQVSGDGCSVRKHWHNETLDNKHGGIVLLEGKLYGYAESQNRSEPWMCIDFKSGETIFQSAPVRSSYKYKNGCLTYADGMFYLFSDDGNMSLVTPMDNGFEVTGRLKVKDPGKRPTWAPPVVFGGRLYIRYGDKLALYDVAENVDRKEK
jgi:outer membrane protein assembly factor BamB